MEPVPPPELDREQAFSKGKTMSRIILVGAFAVLFSAATFSPSAAVTPDRLIQATAAVDNSIEVKRGPKHRPRGWSKGRKVGWGGGRVPPGLRR